MVDLDALEKLANLRDRGALTEEEFNKLKKELLNEKDLKAEEENRKRVLASGLFG